MNYGLIGLAATALVTYGSAARAEDFTGPRVEATIGWDQLRFDLARYGIAGTNKESDIAWGLGVGYDLPLNANLIAGVEASVTFSDVDKAFSDGTTDYGAHARRDLELSGRLGTRIGSNALLYGKLGYTNFRVGQETSSAGLTSVDTVNLDGVRLGTGIKVALSKAAYLKTEYRYSNYQDGVSRNDVVTGLGLRF
ncbi:porin family protein [Sphingosinicella sp. BN140058]|uniref:porin family protein n=1 Tax=Sphingosinicella sp. BN140058 TaxID=1892855 RepID=UPI00101023C4|nr:porin family protein [Sphingosinicella sp. BN140058]QAY78224.1 porin family protein [Sphingosinicella sp. BN140058]